MPHHQRAGRQARQPAHATAAGTARAVARAPADQPTSSPAKPSQRPPASEVHNGVTQKQFATMHMARDATLEMPNLILPSIQVNIRAGQLPPAEANGKLYLKIPLNQL